MKLVSKMVKVAVTLSLAAVIAACGSEKKEGEASGPVAGVAGVYGTWGGFPPVENGDMRITFKLRIEPSRVTNLVTCTVGGRTLSASVSARAEITSDKIKVVEAKEHVARDGGNTCRATIKVGEAGYRLDGNRLTLSSEDGEVLLSRVN